MTDKPCEWCGHVHEVQALCTKRPKWGRRGFLMMLGMGAVGLVLKDIPIPIQRAEVAHWIHFPETTEFGGTWKAFQFDVTAITNDGIKEILSTFAKVDGDIQIRNGDASPAGIIKAEWKELK